MNTLLILLAVAVIFIYFFRRNLKEKFIPNKEKYYTIDDRFNAERKERQNEIDELLSKIGKNGLSDLSPKDKQRLDELSKKTN
ncbi:DUF6576 domain-containing protein [Kaistella carnis]|uniref:DUF6576 domain-containing protein n=1 Tax=Kaistella carnis TaxID=1241979 RepID=UPI0028A7590A|nr:DUF6576 domain-containing protein [Kaistella carnis]